MPTSHGETSTMLGDILLHALRDAPDSDAVISADRCWSFQDLATRASQIGLAATVACPPGGTVAIVGENHPDWVAAYYGVPDTGRILCFLNHRLSVGELLAQIDRSRASLVIGSSVELERLRAGLDARASIRRITFDDELDDDRLGETTEPDRSVPGDARCSDDPAWLLFTSGTTGAPKGALLSHRAILASLNASQVARPIENDEVLAFPFPLCHVAGYNVPRLHQRRRPVVIIERFTPQALVELSETNTVTSVSLAATMLSDLLNYLDENPQAVERLRTLRQIAYGASPMPADLLRRAHLMFVVDLTQGYGMTELSGNAVFLDAARHRLGFDADPSLLRCAGVPGPGVEIRIVDVDDADVPPGDVGEIIARGPQVMTGYLDDDQGTADALRGGWLHTGDLGRIRPDGILEVVDRLKDVIVTGGENVSSLETEEAIRAVCPEIASVAVIGIPDPRWGENVCAVVTWKPGSATSLEEIARRLAGSLAGYKIPRHLVVTESLPLTHSGKVAKAQLRSWLSAEPTLAGPRR